MVFRIEGEVREAIEGGAREAKRADGAANEHEDEEEPSDEGKGSLPVLEKDSTEHGWFLSLG